MRATVLTVETGKRTTTGINAHAQINISRYPILV